MTRLRAATSEGATSLGAASSSVRPRYVRTTTSPPATPTVMAPQAPTPEDPKLCCVSCDSCFSQTFGLLRLCVGANTLVALVRKKGGDTTTRTEIETAGSGKDLGFGFGHVVILESA